MELLNTDTSTSFSKILITFSVKDVMKNEITVNNLSFKGVLKAEYFSINCMKNFGLITENFDLELKKLTDLTFSQLKVSCDYNIINILSQSGEFYSENIAFSNNTFLIRNLSLNKFSQNLAQKMTNDTEYPWDILCSLSIQDSNTILLQSIKINVKYIQKPDIPINPVLTTSQVKPFSNETIILTLTLPDISNSPEIKYNCDMLFNSINVPNMISLEKILLTPPETKIPIRFSLTELKGINWDLLQNNTLYPLKLSCKLCVIEKNCYSNELVINVTYIKQSNNNNSNNNNSNNNSNNNNSNNNDNDNKKKFNETKKDLENIISNNSVTTINSTNCTDTCEYEFKKIQNETVQKLNDVINCSFLRSLNSNETNILTLSAEAIKKITKNHKYITKETSNVLLNITDCLFNQSFEKSFEQENVNNDNSTEMVQQISGISSNLLDLGFSLNYSKGVEKTTQKTIEKDSLIVNNNTKQVKI
jgi:hypothetical protein